MRQTTNEKTRSFIQSRIRDRIRTLKQLLPDADINSGSVQKLVNMINEADCITVLTGAGISTMSGIPDYRSAVEGVWKKNPYLLNDLNQETFEHAPDRFWNAFHQLIKEVVGEFLPFETPDNIAMAIEQIEPNGGHQLFAWLEEQGKEMAIITQNVDALHQKAGNSNVIEMHGTFQRCICPKCQSTYELTEVLKEEVPACSKCGEVLRPDVVFFGDAVRDFEKAEKIVRNSQLVMVAGTSLDVFPFNQLPHIAQAANIKTVLLNATPTPYDNQFDLVIYSDINDICNQVKRRLEHS